MNAFWSTERCGGANYMMLPHALYPRQEGSISHDRWVEMKAFCRETFPFYGGWLTSHLSFSFAFKKESDRLVFLMAFPNG